VRSGSGSVRGAGLHSLVGDAPDGLTLIGDGQQSIYPGGYTLAELGISVTGRAVVMDINYRNTREVLGFAQRMVEGDEVADIEGGVATVLREGDVAGRATRTGAQPVVESFATWGARFAAVTERVRAVTREVGTGLGAVGVLCVGTRAAKEVHDVLRAAGIATVDLLDYDGTQADAVKVGTIKRAKGLEFKQVLMADVRAEWLADGALGASVGPGEVDDDQAEQRTLLRRELYVAMTRARDGLWIGVV